MPGTDDLRHFRRIGKFVIAGFVETDAEGLQLTPRQFGRGQGRHERRIDAPAQKNSQRHVGDHAAAHGGAQQFAQFLDAPLERNPLLRRGLVTPVRPNAEIARSEIVGKRMTSRQLARTFRHGQGRRHVAVGEKFSHSRRGNTARDGGMLQQ